jgi:6-phosphogluconolactonase
MDKLLICSYNNFDLLAHKVKGSQALKPITIIKDNDYLQVNFDCINPAFVIRRGKYVYACCESINDGHILTIDTETNKILKKVSSCGKSSCYLQIDEDEKYIININYWDSTISVHPIINNILEEATQVVLPKNINNINKIEDHLENRQKTSHHHSCAFYKGDLYVPDLGTDKIDIYYYSNGSLKFKSYIQLPKQSGPRYILFINDYLYVINELSSSLSVIKMNPTPQMIQNIKTIPDDIDIKSIKSIKNTCGTIKHNDGYIYASNRGHDSIAIYKILDNHTLELKNIQSTFGKTPRHFEVSNNGKKLYVANQDTNEVIVFKIIEDRLKILDTIKCDSPNFVLCLDN